MIYIRKDKLSFYEREPDVLQAIIDGVYTYWAKESYPKEYIDKVEDYIKSIIKIQEAEV